MSTTAKSLNILLLEPFYGGSHKQWADGLAKYSRHKIHISSLPDRHWKWRMHGSALTFAERHKDDIHQYDLVLVTDLCDVATLRGLLKIDVPAILYFHENQLAYPWSPTDEDVHLQRDRHYMWINYTSAMAADHCWFNSAYNLNSFINELPKFLKPFPDHKNFDISRIEVKSRVLHLGLDLPLLNINPEHEKENETPIILWNHRWEYDKGPDLFFKVLFRLAGEGEDFRLMVLGEKTSKYPTIFDEAKSRLSDRIIHFGYVENKDKYHEFLLQSDIYPVTNHQDFFGISVVEAISAGVLPLLPRGMVYEEYIPSDRYADLYYEDENDLYQKLKGIMKEIPEIQLKAAISQFEWSRMVQHYDDKFSEVFTAGESGKS